MDKNTKFISRDFFYQDVLDVAPALVGKLLVRRFSDGAVRKYQIIETEAYRGEEDKACHVSRGRTPRNQIMYEEGGILYMYLVYGMHWMMNIVTSEPEDPQAVLIRGITGYPGPGKLTKALGIDKTFRNRDITTSKSLWLESCDNEVDIQQKPRVGIQYAPPYWRDICWRFVLKSSS